MVKKILKRRKPKNTPVVKQVVIKKHHAKKYRKRHVGLLVASVLGFVLLSGTLIQYRDQLMIGANSSRDYILSFVTGEDTSVSSVESTYGFSLNFDKNKYYVSAVDGDTGKMYQAKNLDEKLAYTSIQVSPYSSRTITDRSAISINYHADQKPGKSVVELFATALTDAGIDPKNVFMVDSGAAKIGGVNFTSSVWQTSTSDGPFQSLKSSFSLYVADVNGHPMTIVVAEGFVSKPGTHPQYDDIIKSISFSKKTAIVKPSSSTTRVAVKRPSLLDTLTYTNVVSAASDIGDVDASGRVAALYGPAAVKIYNVYAMDINFDGMPFMDNLVGGGTGSGFFVGPDGLIATNGHVATADVKNVAIESAAILYVSTGDSRYLDYLLSFTDFDESKVDMSDLKAAVAEAIDDIYELDSSRFKKVNDVQNLFVNLKSDEPDMKSLVQNTVNRTEFGATKSFVKATLKSYDYRSVNINGFKGSDVAILSIRGDNYPTVRLGSISDVQQGSNLNIIGFPGNASDNSIVDSSASVATLTNGKVSSIKDAEGSKNKLIETTTTIGHGNSGGPVFADNGEVVGLATYTADGGGQGGGTYNYIRDIKDLKDLAAKNSIAIGGVSETQSEWEEGMGYFYTAHYSKALKNFDKVKEFYPFHNKVDEFSATAKKRIDEGLDVKDFPVVAVAIGAVVLLAIVGGTVAAIVLHKKKHNVYAAGVAQGVVAPVTPGVPNQVVSVTPIVQPAGYAATSATQTVQPTQPSAQLPVQSVAPPQSATPVGSSPSQSAAVPQPTDSSQQASSNPSANPPSHNPLM